MKHSIQQFAVIKLGRSVATLNGTLHESHFTNLAVQIKQLLQHGIGVTLVISGSVSCGKNITSLHKSEAISNELAAGIGQAYLTQEIYTMFAKHNILISQMLLTKSDLVDEKKREAIKSILKEGMKKHIVFLLNENDIVELHSFSGNDFLAAEIAKLLTSQYLLLLTDVDGVYEKDMKVIEKFSSFIKIQLAHFSGGEKKNGYGGMEAKILAAQDAANENIATFIADGRADNTIRKIILENKHLGTKFSDS